MKKPITFFCTLLTLLLGLIVNIHAETIPTIKWQKSFGGSGYDSITDSIEAEDGGYLLGGFIQTGISTNDFPPFPTDYYLVKLDESGETEWEKFYGGDGEDTLTCLIQTSDGGYILGGHSTSGISRDKSSPNYGDSDIWIIKLDANFNKLWDRSFGGTNVDWLTCLEKTSDGGCVLGGLTHNAQFDYWVIKMDSNGNTAWNNRYGGSGSEWILSLKQTSDDGYILAGHSNSDPSGNKTSPHLGGSGDGWLVKLDKDGILEWDKAFGGTTDDAIDSVNQTADGGFILSGRRGKRNQQAETWIFKTDHVGNVEWDKTYGSNDHSFGIQKATESQPTRDGGYIVSSLYISESSFSQDCRLLKIDSNGNKQWEKKIEADQDDYLLGLLQTLDGSFLITGMSQSSVSGDKTSPNHGKWDGWVLKVESYFRIDRNEQNVTLSWNAVPGRNYTVQYKSDLSDAEWTDLATVVASGVSASRTESVGPGQRYYRIVGSE